MLSRCLAYQLSAFVCALVDFGNGQMCNHNKPQMLTPEKSCVFPSRSEQLSNDELFYTTCQYNEKMEDWWCPTTGDYCADRQYKWCPRTDATYGGPSPGQLCHFPFIYKGKRYTHCTKADTPRLRAYYWCSTRSEYHKRHWTRCDVKATANFPCWFRHDGIGMDKECKLFQGQWRCRTEGGMLKQCESTDRTEAGNDPGKPCRFPFIYQGIEKFYCQKSTSETETYEWCSTTKDFDKDQRWTRCKPFSIFKLEGILLAVVIVGGCLVGIIILTCFVHYICNPVRYIIKHRRIRRNPPVDDDSHSEDDKEDYDQELSRRYCEAQETVFPSAPPMPPSYADVLRNGVSTEVFAKVSPCHYSYMCQGRLAADNLTCTLTCSSNNPCNGQTTIASATTSAEPAAGAGS